MYEYVLGSISLLSGFLGIQDIVFFVNIEMCTVRTSLGVAESLLCYYE